MLENIRLSFQGIWSHKMRSFLTMLGIIIGIASIIAIVSTIKGTSEQIKQNLVGAGNNAVEISLYEGDYEISFDWQEYDGIPLITEEMRQEMLEFDDVDNVSLYVRRTYVSDIFYKDANFEGGQLYGIDANYFDTSGYTVKKGRGFSENDFSGHRKVAILNEDAVNTLFNSEDPIGKAIEVAGEPYTVIGIVDVAVGFEPVINSLEDYVMYMGESYGTVYVPIDTWPVIKQFDEPQFVVAKASDTDSMSTVGKRIEDYLNTKQNLSVGTTEEESGSNIKYKAADLLERARSLQELSEATNQQLLWIASISLLVGGIGVMNIMLVSVTERTSEIGLKKAIGARKGKILTQFLTEAAVLTGIGGVIGILSGIILAEVISRLASMPVAISVPVIALAVAFSVLIGIIFGLLPSYKAANLNPIEALRRE